MPHGPMSDAAGGQRCSRKWHRLHAAALDRVTVEPARAIGAPLTGGSALACVIASVALRGAGVLVAVHAIAAVAVVTTRAIRSGLTHVQAASLAVTIVAAALFDGHHAGATVAFARRMEFPRRRAHRIVTAAPVEIRIRKSAAIRGASVTGAGALRVSVGAWGVSRTRPLAAWKRSTKAQTIRLVACLTGARAGRFTAHAINARPAVGTFPACGARDAARYDFVASAIAPAEKSALARMTRITIVGAKARRTLHMTIAGVLGGGGTTDQLTDPGSGRVAARMTGALAVLVATNPIGKVTRQAGVRGIRTGAKNRRGKHF